MTSPVPAGEDAELGALRALARRLGVPEDVRLLSPWTPLPAAVGRDPAGSSGAGDLLLRFSPVPVLGVTGTAGKSTTARLAEAMLRASGVEVLTADDAPADNAWPTARLLERVLAARPPAWCVAELTSNHLALCTTSPHIACVTNLWPDHADQHGGLAAYVAAKRRIVAFQGADDWVVALADDEGAAELVAGAAARAAPVTLRGPAGDPGGGVESGRLVVRLDGEAHDLGPAASLPAAPAAAAGLLAATCALLAGATPSAIERTLAGWHGLALRRERIGEVAGSAVIRDALAATPAKAAAGLALHDDASVVLIAGGSDDLGGGPLAATPEEGALLERAAAEAARACVHACLFGPAAARLAPAFAAAGVASVTAHATLAGAARDARAHAAPGRTLLFAPFFPTTPQERAELPALLGLRTPGV